MIEVNFTATDNVLTEADVIEAAKAAFSQTLVDAVPEEDYLQEVLTDLAAGEPAAMWMTAAGFAQAVTHYFEQRLTQIVSDRRGEIGFDPRVRDAIVVEVSDAANAS